MTSSHNGTYNLRAAFVLGSLILLIGVIGIYVQMTMLPQKLDFIDKSSVGFWTGIIFLATGILTLASWKKNTDGMITIVMIVSILTSVACAVGISLSFTFWLKAPVGAGKEHEDDQEYTNKLTLVHMVLFVVEGVLTIVMSAFCCQAVCCGAGEEEPAAVPITTGASQTQPKYQPPGAENPTVRRRRSVDDGQ